MNGHWNNCTPSLPHTVAMMEKAKELEDKARKSEDNEEINFLYETAADLRKYAFAHTYINDFMILHPCPDGLANDCMSQVCDCKRKAQERYFESMGECACVGDQHCPICDKRAGEVYADVMNDYFMAAVNQDMRRE